MKKLKSKGVLMVIVVVAGLFLWGSFSAFADTPEDHGTKDWTYTAPCDAAKPIPYSLELAEEDEGEEVVIVEALLGAHSTTVTYSNGETSTYDNSSHQLNLQPAK